MKRVIYLFQLMLLAAMVTSCGQEQLKNASDIVLSPVYNLHSNSDALLMTSNKKVAIWNVYVYQEVNKVSEVSGLFDANMKVYETEDYVDNSTDEEFDIKFTKITKTDVKDEDGNVVDVTEERTKYVIWGYKDRKPYLIHGEDTPDDPSDDVYTRKELYVKVYDMDGKFLYGSQTQADDKDSNKVNFGKNGLKIFDEFRPIAK